MSQSAELPDAGEPQEAFDAIHGDMLRNFRELVTDLGADPDAVLGKAGIELPPSCDTRARATYRQFVALLELAATELNCPDFGLRLAVRQAATAYSGPLGDGMRNSRTYGDAVRFVATHSYAHSLAAWIWFKPSLSGARTLVGHDILLDGLPQKSQAMEYILLVGTLATRELTGGRVRARQVLFRHQPISELRVYRRYFACEVRFGRSSDAVVYSKQDLAFQISAPDAEARQQAASTIETKYARRKPPLHADVRGVISHILGNEPCTKVRVASVVNMHPRTMQRRLVDAGTSFQQVKDEVRRDRLLYYAGQTDLEFGEISAKLGFSEQAVMTRCCRKWFAKSPTALRHALKR